MGDPKKSLGQHWLHDQASLEAMVEAADVQPNDDVLEIGPGLGTLTAVLLTAGANVTALEFDPELIPSLRAKFSYQSSPTFNIQQGDIRQFDFNTIPDTYKIVANIPYYLTANLMRLLTDEKTHRPTHAALLMQKEVVERITAQPGSMAFLSVAAQYYYETESGREVPAQLFTPPPKVDSQILVLKKRQQPLFPDTDAKDFFRLVKAGYAQRRKTLLNNLSAGLQLDKETAKTICQTVEIDPGRRAQTLSLEEWHNLYLSLNT